MIHERRILLLTKSKDALYLTLDRIRGDRFHVGIQFTLPVVATDSIDGSDCLCFSLHFVLKLLIL